MKMPCGRKRYCGTAKCAHAARCAQMEMNEAKRGGGKKPQPAGTRAETDKALAAPADVVYLYDGSRDGFFCCVFESVYGHELPAAVYVESEAQPTLFEQKLVVTESDKARRVENSIPAKISPRAMELINKVFLSCLPEKEMAMLRFLLLGYRYGSKTPWMMGHEDVAPLLEAEKHIMGEAHLLRGFVRFSDYGGALAATITPKNFILPFLANHFAARYSQENFLIFDKTHGAALIYQDHKRKIVPMDAIEFPEADEKEEEYRALWKQFYNTIAIKERENPRCRMTHMPKRYWENMTEMQDFL